MEMGLEMGWRVVIVEGDSHTVLKKCMASTQDKSVPRPYIRNITHIAKDFQEVRFRYVPRSANELANKMVRESLK